MTKPIRRAGVIGAGVMGSGIAAHLANAGVEVVLLDIVPPNLKDSERTDPAARSRFATGGLEKALKARPAAFFHPSFARSIRTGNTEDDLGLLAGCDLIIEAIIEQLEPKRALFAKLEEVARPDAIIASNTSGLRIEGMMEGRSESFRKRFLVMHFFNPVRYMKLLELVAGPDTDPDTVERVRRFGEDVLGKGIVFGKDTPNFIANRIGAHAMMTTIHLMLEEGLSPEDVDAITGVAMAHPKSASFRTADVVGLDTFAHVADNCFNSLKDDEDRKVFEVPAYIRTMVEKKLLGDKTRGGFYRKGKGGDIETLDPKTLEYRARGGDPEVRKAIKGIEQIEDPAARVRALVADQGKAGRFAWKVLSRSLAYSARRLGEIAGDVAAIDDGVRWGYNWDLGPFQTWDALGFTETVARMEKDGIALPETITRMRDQGAKGFYDAAAQKKPTNYDDFVAKNAGTRATYSAEGAMYDVLAGKPSARAIDPRTVPLAWVRRGEKAVLSNDGAEAWDLGDGVLGVTFKSKANSIDADVITLLGQAADKAEADFRALLVFNQGDHFCVGANLFMIAMAATNKDWENIRLTVKAYQDATQRLKYASVPVVVAPFGMTLGGGLELSFAGASVQAAAETYAGLVEVGVGLIPGGAGTLNMLWRALEGIPEGAQVNTLELTTQVFKNIALAKVATSADEAKALGYFRKTDGVTFDRARHLAEAKGRAIGLAESGYHAPAPRAYKLAGESGIATLSMMVDTLVAGGYASEHDATIARKLATVLCGGKGGAAREVTESEILELEREAFVSLCGEEKSLERIKHMLMTNKPLRN
ncbi:3-hydroxyacyl-CoA dehydrogenase/enoyl-CoA hydratase family protein [Chondromyces apiculatus]|uniref:Enoyl-CoA hydratase in isoleucine degradation n=1 Tax=Chondromyces apiculatus DSM 436 TaxID=1192034 RepID=A0A017TC23_9BACT|nr:3-hydroxyacyl-CoA dehydrogenase/enoyl-CoA hydratase family protein [Chondromyces apiculatus]EYF06457.1 Enoyl-CoA hydratase in isoleucine degradation [Chondromyces apiculatus DSM 436]